MRGKLKGLNDTELALLAKEGDASAFEEIYDRHATGVARALASYAGPDRDVLDDLTQETFFRVIAGLASYVPSRPFPHWLYTIALNVGRNHVRRKSMVVLLDPDELDGLSSDQSSAVDLSDGLFEAKLVRLVAGLPDHLREVVSLRTGSGMSYGEIGEVLGVPEGTARSRMHNAVRMLREKTGVTVSKKERR